MDQKIVTIRFPSALASRLETLAADQGITLPELIRQLCVQHFETRADTERLSAMEARIVSEIRALVAA